MSLICPRCGKDFGLLGLTRYLAHLGRPHHV
jgi:hypothetical protein